MNHSIETLKSNHEEEISNLVTENHHLQAMLNDVKGQVINIRKIVFKRHPNKHKR